MTYYNTTSHEDSLLKDIEDITSRFEYIPEMVKRLDDKIEDLLSKLETANGRLAEAELEEVTL